MNLMQLKYFNAVCEYGTVSGAAEFLHIAQPSVSNAVKELENEFGVMLFKRHHRGMVPTYEGEVLLKLARDILEKAAGAEKIMKDLGSDKKTLKLGVPPMTGSLILPKIYGDFVNKNKDISLEIIECGRQDMIRKIQDNELDMAFISHNQQLGNEFGCLKASTLEIVCGLKEGNNLYLKKSIKASDLENVPLVMFEDGFFQTATIKRWFSLWGVTPRILMQTAQLSTILRIISSGTATGFMFKKLIEKNKGISSVSMDPPIYADISLIWKKDKYFFSGMRRFKVFLENNDLFE